MPLPRVGEQSICTPGAAGILQFLMDAKARKQRIVSVSPHYIGIEWLTGAGASGYIVILEETVESVVLTADALMDTSPRERDL